MSSAKAIHDDPSIAREAQRIRAAKATQARQFESWDALLKTPAFQDYTAHRGLEIRNVLEGLPYAPEAEMSCLGAMMLSGRACRLALSELRPPCFGFSFNRVILTACAVINQRACRGERIKVDFPTVASQIRRGKEYQEGILDHAKECIEACPSAVNVRAYIREIQECSRLRHQIELSEIMRSAAFGGAHPGQIINATRKALDTIEQRSYCDLKDVFESCK